MASRDQDRAERKRQQQEREAQAIRDERQAYKQQIKEQIERPMKQKVQNKGMKEFVCAGKFKIAFYFFTYILYRYHLRRGREV